MTNPWLTQPTEPDPHEAAPAAAPVRAATGPTAPQRDMTIEPARHALPIVDRWETAELWWVGAHGGSAETSLAGLVPGWVAAGHAWPKPFDGTRARVVLTARTSMGGLLAAQAAATQWAAGVVPHVDLLGLVLVADAPGRIPKALRAFGQVVRGGAPREWSVPWIESWRLGESLALDAAPREVRRLVEELHALIEAGAGGASTTGRNTA